MELKGIRGNGFEEQEAVVAPTNPVDWVNG